MWLMYGLVATVLTSIYSGCLAQLSCQSKSGITLRDTYDFVIVGAGSAGSVVAHRLSEDTNVTVLLLEAGGKENALLNEIPQMYNHLWYSEQDWKFLVHEDLQDSPLVGNIAQKPIWPRGKVLGGSSSINGMMYVRGNRRDYDSWNDTVGGGWSYEEVLPFFKKSEDNRVDNMNETYHGKGGPLTVSESSWVDPTADFFLQAAHEMGWNTTDVNGETQTGIMPVQYTIRDGARCSADKAFLRSASHRHNLDIVTHAYVERVILEKNSTDMAKATGVIFQCGNTSQKALASKEVILSAGTIKSPHLLLISGIGPRQQLEKFNISTIVDLPGVGENLRDQVLYMNMRFVADKLPNENACDTADDLQYQLVDWAFNRKGRLTQPIAQPNLVAFVETTTNSKRTGWPDIQYIFTQYYGIPQSANTTDRLVSLCSPILLKPKSQGVVRLQSANPHDQPIIEPRFLRSESDVDGLIRGTNICFQLAKTKALLDANVRLEVDRIPACAKYVFLSEEYMRCIIRLDRVSSSHCTGTCKMGKSNDSMAVVDNELRVFNVTGLRVVDASIMPDMPSGNTNAPTIMVGERASDFIQKSWNLATLN